MEEDKLLLQILLNIMDPGKYLSGHNLKDTDRKLTPLQSRLLIKGNL